eukprot:3754126-Pleurochrysis_carterae.AAC.1
MYLAYTPGMSENFFKEGTPRFVFAAGQTIGCFPPLIPATRGGVAAPAPAMEGSAIDGAVLGIMIGLETWMATSKRTGEAKPK